jgi:hypothetical protein
MSEHRTMPPSTYDNTLTVAEHFYICIKPARSKFVFRLVIGQRRVKRGGGLFLRRAFSWDWKVKPMVFPSIGKSHGNFPKAWKFALERRVRSRGLQLPAVGPVT